MTVPDVDPPRLDPGALAALEDQRDFLLASIEDLERELAAGDVDEHDYLALKDDYTARAAAVLRSIEAGRRRAARGSPRPSRARTVAAIAGVLAFSVLAGLLVAQAAGRRDAGDTLTGGTRQSVTEKLNEAGRRGAEGDLQGAIGLYDEVLEVDPANAEALTYQGWLLTLSGESEAGLTSLLEAATADPDYPDVHAFLAILFLRNGLVEQADRELDRFESLDPPASVRQLTEGLRAEIDAALASTTTTPTTTP
jgi:tetratricopeptide (TPR) repeat protein